MQHMESAEKKRKKPPTKGKVVTKDDTPEEVCFFCKDGGDLRICDFEGCTKAYHHECVGKAKSFLEDDVYWKCAWHSCMQCGKSPKFHCFCCPKAVCGRCLCDVVFGVVTSTRGFCDLCLTLAGLIEGTKTAAHGQEVDFDAQDSYEYFFKYYWEGEVKVTEGLTAEVLVSAEKQLEKEILDRQIELDPVCESDYAAVSPGKQRKSRRRGKVSEGKHPVKMKRFMSKKREFSGWGSKVLVEFLTSIGKDISQQLSQHEVAEIIKRYAAENNLFDPEKKKQIVCDAQLNMLFGRKSVNKNRILGHLTKHFADNQSDDDPEEDWFVVDGEDDVQLANKKPRTSEANCRDKVAAVPIVKRRCFASVTTENMKLVFLKKSVVEELSKDSDNFDVKVVGSFVRVKADPHDYSQKNSHLLVQVTGVRRQFGESTECILLQVSDMMGDMPICKLSDENFTKEECQDLRQRVKNGFIKRPVIVEFEEKVRVLHESITKDWIQRELVILKRLRDQASLKGWRRELAEYMERLAKLQKPDEQSRLLQEIPEVVVDEEELEPASEEICKDGQEAVEEPETTLRFSKGSRIIWCPTDQADVAVNFKNVAGDEVADNCPSGLARCGRLSDKEEECREEKSRNTKTNHRGIDWKAVASIIRTKLLDVAPKLAQKKIPAPATKSPPSIIHAPPLQEKEQKPPPQPVLDAEVDEDEETVPGKKLRLGSPDVSLEDQSQPMEQTSQSSVSESLSSAELPPNLKPLKRPMAQQVTVEVPTSAAIDASAAMQLAQSLAAVLEHPPELSLEHPLANIARMGVQMLLLAARGQREMEELLADRARLASSVERLQSDLDHANRRREELVKTCEDAKLEAARLASRLETEREKMCTEIEAELFSNYDAELEAERSQFNREEALLQEKEVLLKEKSALEQEKETLKRDKAATKKHYEELKRAMNALEGQLTDEL